MCWVGLQWFGQMGEWEGWVGQAMDPTADAGGTELTAGEGGETGRLEVPEFWSAVTCSRFLTPRPGAVSSRERTAGSRRQVAA